MLNNIFDHLSSHFCAFRAACSVLRLVPRIKKKKKTHKPKNTGCISLTQLPVVPHFLFQRDYHSASLDGTECMSLRIAISFMVLVVSFLVFKETREKSSVNISEVKILLVELSTKRPCPSFFCKILGPVSYLARENFCVHSRSASEGSTRVLYLNGPFSVLQWAVLHRSISIRRCLE